MTVLSIQYNTAAFDAAAGDISVVAADANNKINVHAFVIVQDTADSTWRWEDGAGGTALTGIMESKIDESVVVPFSEVPWFSTSLNTALSLEAATGAAAGFIIYSLTT